MTPQELDAILADFVRGNQCCRLCATKFDSSDSALCDDCIDHMMDHGEDPGAGDEGQAMEREPLAEKLLMLLGLTKGCENLASMDNLTDEVFMDGVTHREGRFFKMIRDLREHSKSRQRMLWARYCALYVPHTIDVLVASQGAGPLGSFNCFTWLLNEMRSEPSWTQFLLSDDPRARSGNTLALVLAEQMVLLSPKWGRQTDLPMTFTFMRNASLVLGQVLSVQVDKPAAVPLPPALRAQLEGLITNWGLRWSKNKILMDGIPDLFAYIRRDKEPRYYTHAREIRDLLEQKEKCAREGCVQKRNLYQCSRCEAVLYCSRQHQSDHWRAEPLPHKQICYRPCF